MNRHWRANRRISSPISLICTLLIIYWVKQSFIILPALLIVWYFLFKPLNRTELIMFAIGTIFIIGQNYSVLKSGAFTFRQQDFLLMPFYEPVMWGYYYLSIKRFILEPEDKIKLSPKTFIGLLITSFCFSIFSSDSNLMTISSTISTFFLVFLFHDRYDFYYAGCALGLGFIIELFGVVSGNWSYPEPDIFGIPFWFITMWISVGILGRRFLIPMSAWLNQKFSSPDRPCPH